jgi:hypothetical protein
MSIKRFKTNRRLWFWISLVLFVLPWFLPIDNVLVDRPVVFWIALFTHLGDAGETLGALEMIGVWSVLLGLPAICVGWVLQCVVVMIRGERKVSAETLDFDDVDPETLAPKIGEVTEESIVRSIREDREQSQ